MQHGVCLILITVLFMACGGKSELGPPPDLFALDVISNPPGDFKGRTVAKRHRFARLNPIALQRLAEVGSRVRLNLFDDLAPIAIFTDSQLSIAQSRNHAGHLESDPESSVALSFTQEVMTGAVTTGAGRQFQVSHIDAGNYAIFEITPPAGRLKGN